MALINESVLDIERKREYARIVLRVLKECNRLKEFSRYLETASYYNFAKRYTSKYYNCTKLWYDREYCASILGCCNFEWFLEKRYGEEKANEYSCYNLVLCYLALFHEKEFNYEMIYREAHDAPEEYIKKCLNGDLKYKGKKDAEMVRKWLELKEILYGDKN